MINLVLFNIYLYKYDSIMYISVHFSCCKIFNVVDYQYVGLRLFIFNIYFFFITLIYVIN